MRRIQVITALLAAMVLLFSCGIEYAAAANDIVQVQVKAEFKYSEARKVLDLINAFRTGKDAWYLAEDNVTRISASGLGKLKYDYNLERVAMQRALEIAAYFSHTRPNGSGWSTAFPSGYKGGGENLAYGYGSVSSVFTAWAEEDKDYAGQGHRRNMLRKEFTSMGVGAVKVGNVMYWAQEFGIGGGSGGGSDSNRFKSDKIDVSLGLLVKNAKSISTEQEVLSIAVDDSVSLPKVVIYSMSGARLYLKNSDWSVKNKKIAKIKKSKVLGVKKGNTTVETSVGGKKVKLPVEVTAKAKKKEIVEIIDDYDPPLDGGDFLILLEEDECFGLDFEADAADEAEAAEAETAE